MLRIAWFCEKIDQKNILNFLNFFWKKRKVLRIVWFGEKVDQTFCLKILPPPPDFLGFFYGYSADTCTEKFPLTSMGGWAECPAVRTRERGPPSASAEFFSLSTAITVLPERVVVGFPNFAWTPKKNNKNLGKKKFHPAPPWPPGGRFFRFFSFFLRGKGRCGRWLCRHVIGPR